MSDDLSILLIVALGTLGVLPVLFGFARLSKLLKKDRAANAKTKNAR